MPTITFRLVCDDDDEGQQKKSPPSTNEDGKTTTRKKKNSKKDASPSQKPLLIKQEDTSEDDVVLVSETTRGGNNGTGATSTPAAITTAASHQNNSKKSPLMRRMEELTKNAAATGTSENLQPATADAISALPTANPPTSKRKRNVQEKTEKSKKPRKKQSKESSKSPTVSLPQDEESFYMNYTDEVLERWLKEKYRPKAERIRGKYCSNMILFPQKLHKALDEAKYESIFSWQPHGRSFKVHKRDEFVKTVLPLFSKSGRTYASFQRQLNHYGIQRCDVPGPDKGSYYHPHFLRGCFDLCKDYMSRKQSVFDKKSVQDGIENLFDVNKGLFTAANTIPIHSSRESSTSNQLNGTTSPMGWSENVDPKVFGARPPYHGARIGATHRHDNYEPQFQNENLTVPPLLGREMHPRDIRFSQIAHRSREYDHNPSWTTGRNTPYNSSHLQQKSYGVEEFQGISCNPNHYYEKHQPTKAS